MSFGALSDIRIIDLTQMLAGPYCTMMLADHGVEVIKVEPPTGDMTRPNGPWHDDDMLRTHGGYFQSVNRNKKSIVLDLKSVEGRTVLLKLIRDADAITENFRVGVMDKLGLSYEVLREENPKLVYGALRGFGDPRTGRSPYAEWPAFDVIAQAMGGIIGITGPDPDHPTKVGPGIGDIVPGMMLAFGVLSAIHHARRTGTGQFVDVAMLDAVLAVCERGVYQYDITDRIPVPIGNGHPFMCPFGMYPAKDGHVTIAAPHQRFFELLCDLIDAPDVKADERFASPEQRSRHRDVLERLLCDVTSHFTKAELSERLGGRIPFGPVLQMDEIAENRHFAARQMIVPVEQPGSTQMTHVSGIPVKLSETPGGIHHRGPYLGEHTEEVLRQSGITDSEIEKIKAALPA